jgi:putative ABC transport system substrate-binding protein
VGASTDDDLYAKFPELPVKGIAALSVNFDAFFGTRREHIPALALKYRIPAVYANRSYAQAGGLMSYGVDIPEGYRWGGRYVARILSGEKTAELPVIEPVKFELVINPKKPPRHSASPCRNRCSPAPTR